MPNATAKPKTSFKTKKNSLRKCPAPGCTNEIYAFEGYFDMDAQTGKISPIISGPGRWRPFEDCHCKQHCLLFMRSASEEGGAHLQGNDICCCYGCGSSWPYISGGDRPRRDHAMKCICNTLNGVNSTDQVAIENYSQRHKTIASDWSLAASLFRDHCKGLLSFAPVHIAAFAGSLLYELRAGSGNPNGMLAAQPPGSLMGQPAVGLDPKAQAMCPPPLAQMFQMQAMAMAGQAHQEQFPSQLMGLAGEWLATVQLLQRGQHLAPSHSAGTVSGAFSGDWRSELKGSEGSQMKTEQGMTERPQGQHAQGTSMERPQGQHAQGQHAQGTSMERPQGQHAQERSMDSQIRMLESQMQMEQGRMETQGRMLEAHGRMFDSLNRKVGLQAASLEAATGLGNEAFRDYSHPQQSGLPPKGRHGTIRPPAELPGSLFGVPPGSDGRDDLQSDSPSRSPSPQPKEEPEEETSSKAAERPPPGQPRMPWQHPDTYAHARPVMVPPAAKRQRLSPRELLQRAFVRLSHDTHSAAALQLWNPFLSSQDMMQTAFVNAAAKLALVGIVSLQVIFKPLSPEPKDGELDNGQPDEGQPDEAGKAPPPSEPSAAGSRQPSQHVACVVRDGHDKPFCRLSQDQIPPIWVKMLQAEPVLEEASGQRWAVHNLPGLQHSTQGIVLAPGPAIMLQKHMIAGNQWNLRKEEHLVVSLVLRLSSKQHGMSPPKGCNLPQMSMDVLSQLLHSS